MADRNKNRVYLIVGAIIVVVALLFFFMSGRNTGTGTIETTAPGTAPGTGGGNTVIIDTPDTGAAASRDVTVEPAPTDPATTPIPAN